MNRRKLLKYLAGILPAWIAVRLGIASGVLALEKKDTSTVKPEKEPTCHCRHFLTFVDVNGVGHLYFDGRDILAPIHLFWFLQGANAPHKGIELLLPPTRPVTVMLDSVELKKADGKEELVVETQVREEMKQIMEKKPGCWRDFVLKKHKEAAEFYATQKRS